MIGAKNRYVSRVKALRKCKLDLQKNDLVRLVMYAVKF